jgi:hypothetical protein
VVLGAAALIQNFFGHPDCSKIATTQIVQKAEQLLQQNLAAWQSLTPQEKTWATQQQALANFDAVWAQVVQSCNTGAYGTAGQACVNDRKQGACHYQNNGQCWNWFIGYRDPIANDPAVAASAPAALSNVLPALAGIDSTLLFGMALVGRALLLAERDRLQAWLGEVPQMPRKWAPEKAKMRPVFGQARKRPKMFLARVYNYRRTFPTRTEG